MRSRIDSANRACFAVLHDPQALRIEGGRTPQFAQTLWWFVHRLIGQLECAPVRREKPQGLSILVCMQLSKRTNCVVRIHVYGAHEPPGFVGADWQDCDVERPTFARN